MWGDPPILVCLELFCVKPKVLHRRTPGWSVALGAPPSPQGKDKVEPSKFPLMRKAQCPMQGGGTQGELCLYFSFSPVLGIEAGMMSGNPAACRWDTSGVTRTVFLTLSLSEFCCSLRSFLLPIPITLCFQILPYLLWPGHFPVLNLQYFLTGIVLEGFCP